jgi:hypothetical protein
MARYGALWKRKACFRGRNMKRILVVGVVAVTFGLLVHSSLAEKETKDLMRQKLNYSQGILEGLTLEKFDLIVTNAALLRNLSVTNVFSMTGNQDYRARSTNFFRSVDSLINAARDQNLERATEAYTHVTRSCVECHKMFRREQFLKSQTDGTFK